LCFCRCGVGPFTDCLFALMLWCRLFYFFSPFVVKFCVLVAKFSLVLIVYWWASCCGLWSCATGLHIYIRHLLLWGWVVIRTAWSRNKINKKYIQKFCWRTYRMSPVLPRWHACEFVQYKRGFLFIYCIIYDVACNIWHHNVGLLVRFEPSISRIISNPGHLSRRLIAIATELSILCLPPADVFLRNVGWLSLEMDHYIV
jgi:hypothetical protein